MKKILTTILFLIATVTYGATYYVAPTTATPAGNDSNAGTLAAPWATWGKAFNATYVDPGDTVFFRGGTYTMTVTNGDGYNLSASGTAGNWIVYSAYLNEVPILDCSNVNPTSGHNYAMDNDASENYVKFIGLHIKNVKQVYTDVIVNGWRTTDGIFTFENCSLENIDGYGFVSWFNGYDDGTHTYINCDAYRCADSLSSSLPGNDGCGFRVNSPLSSSVGSAYYKNCRAWLCGDDGYESQDNKYTEYEGCWSFANGLYDGDGNGWKFGWSELASANLRLTVKNCVSVYNRYSGFVTNDFGYEVVRQMDIFNNTCYNNGNGYFATAYGIWVYNTGASDAQELRRVFRNNISYHNQTGNILVGDGATYTHSYNSWDTPPGVTLSDADFVSVDSTGISAARQADGSLPNNDCYNEFLRIATGSDLIDAGTDVGIDYNGLAPDLGAFETGTSEPSDATDILTFTFTEQTGSATINATLHTVSIEVEWDAVITSLTPTITVSGGATIDPTSGTARNFTSPVTYTVTAEDTVTEQVWTITVTQEAEPSTGIKLLKSGIKLLKKGTKFLK